MCISGLRERESGRLCGHMSALVDWERESGRLCALVDWERESGQLCALVDWGRESGRLCALLGEREWPTVCTSGLGESGRLCALVNGERGSSCPEGMVFRCERWLLVDWCILEAGFNLDICP